MKHKGNFPLAIKLEFPSFSHHNVEIYVVVYRCTDTNVVIEKLLLSHFSVRIARSVEVFQELQENTVFCPISILILRMVPCVVHSVQVFDRDDSIT